MEGEVFLIGIWKNYDELEEALSMPELIATLDASRESRYQDRKFFAALQGVDLDGGEKKEKPVDKLAEMRTLVMTGGKYSDPNDILAYSGANARATGFGIGQGLTHSEGDTNEWWKR